MCSVDEDDADAARFMERPSPSTVSGDATCNKCGTDDVVVLLRRKDHYCEACFTAAAVHKFRANFGKTKLVKPDANVAIAYSGDVRSAVLLDLVENSLEENAHKKLRFDPVILYIDEGVTRDSTSEERLERTSKVIHYTKSKNLPIYVCSISEAMDLNRVRLESKLTINEKTDELLHKLIKSMKTQTARRDLLKKLKRTLLVELARKCDCSYILTADTATDLATDSLVNIALGGGSHLASDAGFCDDRNDVKILRPMKDFSSEELNYFQSIKNVSYISSTEVTNKESNIYCSVQSRVKSFVDDLQSSFPATVSTIVRTSQKTENDKSSSTETKCILCQSKLDTESEECSSLRATIFSEQVSNLSDNFKNCTIQEGECSNCNKTKGINDSLCYSCRLTTKDMTDIKMLPLLISSETKRKIQEAKMKDMIQDFLL